MNADGIRPSSRITFSFQEKDFPPLQEKQKKIRQEEIQKINHIANHNLQTSLPKNKNSDKSLSPYRDFTYLKTSAENGSTADQFTLAMMYFKGTAIARNCVEGEKWLTKAAEKGHREAKRKLHAMNFQGEGIAE